MNTRYPIPQNYYIVSALFANLGWGVVSDGYSTRSEAMALAANYHAKEEAVHVLHVRMDEGRCEDVTDEMLDELAPDETAPGDDPSDYAYQRRAANIAGHFA